MTGAATILTSWRNSVKAGPFKTKSSLSSARGVLLQSLEHTTLKETQPKGWLSAVTKNCGGPGNSSSQAITGDRGSVSNPIL